MKKSLAILLMLCLGSCSKTEKKVAEKAVTEETVGEKLVTKKPVYMSDLVEVEGKLYEKYSDVPYTGDVIDTTYWVRAPDSTEGYIHLGYRTGIWLTKKYRKTIVLDFVFPDSLVSKEKSGVYGRDILLEISYKDNKLIYVKSFHENGEIELFTTYWDNGEKKKMDRFNDKGGVTSKMSFNENGRSHGYFLEINSEGDTVSSIFRHGELINTSRNSKSNNK